LDHRGIHPQPPRAQHPPLDRQRQQLGVELLDQLGPQPPRQLDQRRGVRDATVQRDPTEPPPGQRVGHLPAQRLVTQPVAVLEKHQPQIGLDRDRRAARGGGQPPPKRLQEALLIEQRIDRGQLPRQLAELRRQHRLPQTLPKPPLPQHSPTSKTAALQRNYLRKSGRNSDDYFR